jgi:hypothetical protein
MKYKSLFSLALLLVVTGCNSAVSDRPQPADGSQSSIASQPDRVSQLDSSSPQPLIKPSESPIPSLSIPSTVPSTAPSTAPSAVSSAPKPSHSAVSKPQTAEPRSESPSLPINPDSQSPESRGSSSAQSSTSANGDIERDFGLTTPIAATGKITARDRIRFVDADRLFTPCPTDTAPYALAESTHYRVQVCSEEFDPQVPKYYIGQAKDGGGEMRITSSNPNEARQLVFKNADYTYVLYRDGRHPEQTNAYLEVYEPDGKSYAEALFYLYQ